MDFFKNLFDFWDDEVYSTKTNSFKFKKSTDFWNSIAFAQERGRNGKGVKIAVVDIAFDLSYPALKAKTKLYRRYSTYDSSELHGNIVALLILEVAPEVDLYLFDIGKDGMPDPDYLDLATKEILELEMDIVNLSWGKKIPKKVHSATELAIEHCTCNVCSKVKPLAEQMLVVTSVGNDSNYQYCPSTVPNVLNIGFQYENIKKKKASDDGKISLAEATQPLKYSQSLNTHFTIMQPKNLIGSSFASPLFVGILALMENPKNDLSRYLSITASSSIATSLFTSSTNNQTIENRSPEIEKIFLEGLRNNPHGFYCNKNDFCFECSIFCLVAYSNLALLYLNNNQYPYAEKLALTAIRVAPFSANPYSILATSIRVRIEREIDDKTSNPTTIPQLEDSIDFYNKAMERNPELKDVYKTGQLKSYELLEKLKRYYYLNMLYFALHA